MKRKCYDPTEIDREAKKRKEEKSAQLLQQQLNLLDEALACAIKESPEKVNYAYVILKLKFEGPFKIKFSLKMVITICNFFCRSLLFHKRTLTTWQT